jgi:osmotically-inducible protein OsmY
MLATQIPTINPDEFSRCEENGQMKDFGKNPSPIQKTDAAIKGLVDRALWNDDVLRAIEYYEIDAHVKNGFVYLNGHIVSTTSQARINNALRAVPGLLGIQNNLVSDDKLILEVAASLGNLEHTYDCKFFTGASHGVISLDGNVSDENVKLFAEKCVASNPNVRGVINNVRVSGAELELQDGPFRQPTIGEIIYFLDGISGLVKQVIINPNNRRVVAMTVWGQFEDQGQDIKPSNIDKSRLPERLVIVPMDVVRHMTTVSGFLHINSHEKKRYMDFDPTRFSPPKDDWKAPYPYCPDDVLFPFEHQPDEDQTSQHLSQTPSSVALKEQLLWEQLLADESLGG